MMMIGFVAHKLRHWLNHLQLIAIRTHRYTHLIASIRHTLDIKSEIYWNHIKTYSHAFNSKPIYRQYLFSLLSIFIEMKQFSKWNHERIENERASKCLLSVDGVSFSKQRIWYDFHCEAFVHFRLRVIFTRMMFLIGILECDTWWGRKMKLTEKSQSNIEIADIHLLVTVTTDFVSTFCCYSCCCCFCCCCFYRCCCCILFRVKYSKHTRFLTCREVIYWSKNACVLHKTTTRIQSVVFDTCIYKCIHWVILTYMDIQDKRSVMCHLVLKARKHKTHISNEIYCFMCTFSMYGNYIFYTTDLFYYAW